MDRGLDPRRSWLRWGTFGLVTGLVIGLTAPPAIEALATTWSVDRSSLPWVIERLFAFLAYLALAGSVIYGLLLSTKLLDAISHRPVTYTLHQDLANIGIGLAAIHGLLLLIDQEFSFTIAEIVVPGLSPHAPIGVAAGQIAFYLMLVVTLSFEARRRIGQRVWRAIHHLAFLAFAGATAHGILAGSDTSQPWAWGLYVAATVIVVFLVTYRVGITMSGGAKTPTRRIDRTAPTAQGPVPEVPMRLG